MLRLDALGGAAAARLARQPHTLSVPPSPVTNPCCVNARFLPGAEGEAGSSLAIVLAVFSALAGFAAIRFLGVRSFRE